MADFRFYRNGDESPENNKSRGRSNGNLGS
jgi:hypothetical protein